MKIYKYYLPLLFVGMLMLSACSERKDSGGAPSKIDSETPVSAVTDMPIDDEMKEGDILTEVSVGDGNTASIFRDQYSCQDLDDEMRRQSCENAVADLIGTFLQAEILETYSLNRCDELPAVAAASCRSQLEATGVQGPVSVAELMIFNEAINGPLPENMMPSENVQIDEDEGTTYNKTKCAELATTGFREYCERLIEDREQARLLNQIIASENASRCTELQNEALREDCEFVLANE